MPQVGNDPRNGSWEREFEKNGIYSLPDCRVRYLDRDSHRVRIRGQMWDIVYCAGPCGKPWMGVNPDCPHVFFICDNCVRDYGAPPDCVRAPEA
jgi:hypothetical protein